MFQFLFVEILNLNQGVWIFKWNEKIRKFGIFYFRYERSVSNFYYLCSKIYFINVTHFLRKIKSNRIIYIIIILSCHQHGYPWPSVVDSWKFTMLLLYIHLMRWQTNFYDFSFKWTATAAIGIHPTKVWLSLLVNFKNAIWTWGYFRRTICNKIGF